GATMGWGVYQLFRTRDERQVFIAVTANRHWAGLCEVLGFDDWKNAPEFDTNKKRAQHRPRLAQRIQEAVVHYTFDDICARLYRAGIPNAPVNTPLDLLEERHLREGGRWLNLNVPERNLRVPKLPFDLGTTQDFAVRQQPDTLGHDSDRILS